jgi:hypothetical protein
MNEAEERRMGSSVRSMLDDVEDGDIAEVPSRVHYYHMARKVVGAGE